MLVRHQITLVIASAVFAILGLCAALFLLLARAERDAGEVTRTKDIIGAVEHVMLQVQAAKISQRSYILTKDASYIATYKSASARILPSLDRAEALMQHPPAKARMITLRPLIEAEMQEQADAVQLGRTGRFEALKAVLNERQALIAQIWQIIGEVRTLQERLLAVRSRHAAQQTRLLNLAFLIGGPLVASLLVLLGFTAVRGITRPLQRLVEATKVLKAGSFSHTITVDSRNEFGELAAAFNSMAEAQAFAFAEKEKAEVTLLQVNEDLQSRGQSVEVLAKMAQRLQSTATEREFAQIIRVFAPQVLYGRPGALYGFNNSRNLLVRLAYWGGSTAPAEIMPVDCWALRRGQQHIHDNADPEVACAHVDDSAQPYACLPLMARGDVIGLLHTEGALDSALSTAAAAMAENIALALMNHRLRISLREQSIRDALTGLFNRRYLEEALQLEFARAERSNALIGLIMLDVDHFRASMRRMVIRSQAQNSTTS
jgi:CHASE3 domain sensor protein/GAF domain-containing protein